MTDRQLEEKLALAVEHAAPDQLESILSRCADRSGVVIPLRKKRPFARMAVAACLALLLVGSWLRYALTRAGAPWDEDLDRFRCALSAAAGAVVLMVAYLLDVSRLLRWAKWVYIGAVAVGVLSLHLSPTVNNASYFTRYVVLFYPVAYAF